MKIKKNLSPNEAAGAGAAEQPAATSFFGIKSAAEAFEDTPNPEGAGAEGGAEGDAGKGAEGAAEQKKVAPPKKTETPAAEKTNEGEETDDAGEGDEAAGEDGGEGTDEVLKLEETDADAEPETTWDDLAKEYALPEIEDKTLQGQDKFNAQLEALKKQEREAGKAEAQQVELARYEPQAQEFFHALNAGMKMEQILKPAHAAYAAIALPDTDLVKEHLIVNLKQTEEQAAEQMEILEANGQLGLEASKLRAQLNTYAEGLVKGEVSKYAEKYKAEQTRLQKETERENQAIASEIRARTEYLEGKVPKEVQDKLVKRWESGQYKNLMANSPKDVVDFIFWKEFGQSRVAKMKENVVKDVKKDTFKKLANTPKTAGGSVPKTSNGGEQDFSAWKGVQPAGIEYGKPN